MLVSCSSPRLTATPSWKSSLQRRTGSMSTMESAIHWRPSTRLGTSTTAELQLGTSMMMPPWRWLCVATGTPGSMNLVPASSSLNWPVSAVMKSGLEKLTAARARRSFLPGPFRATSLMETRAPSSGITPQGLAKRLSWLIPTVTACRRLSQATAARGSRPGMEPVGQSSGTIKAMTRVLCPLSI